MLGDALSLWKNASNALQYLNENVSASLVVDNGDEDDSGGNKSEIEIYKKMVEDAQMQHLELSRQFRKLLGDKDVELNFWKSKVESDAMSDDDKERLDTSLLAAELKNMEENLKLTEDELRKAISERNEGVVSAQMLSDMNAELETLKYEVRQLTNAKAELETQKTETIDQLVNEYSTLAADSERQKSLDSQRIKETELENEILMTKLQALQQSFGDFNPTSTTINNARSGSRDSNDHGNDNSAIISNLNREITELKTRIIHLEYDDREKDEKIKSQLQLLETKPSVTMTEASNLTGTSCNQEDLLRLNELQQQMKELQISLAKTSEELRNTTEDKRTVSAEKGELEIIAKEQMDLNRQHMKEIESLKKKLKDEEKENMVVLDSLAVKHATEIESVRQQANSQIAELEALHARHLNDGNLQSEEFRSIEEQKKKKESEMQNEIKKHQDNIQQLSESIAKQDMDSKHRESELQNEIKKHQDNIQQLKDSLLEHEEKWKLSLKNVSSEQEAELQMAIEKYEKQIKELTDKNVNDISHLESVIREKEAEAKDLLASELSNLKQAMLSDFAVQLNAAKEETRQAGNEEMKRELQRLQDDLEKEFLQQKLDLENAWSEKSLHMVLEETKKQDQLREIALSAQHSELEQKHNQLNETQQAVHAEQMSRAIDELSKKHALEVEGLLQSHSSEITKLKDMYASEKELMTIQFNGEKDEFERKLSSLRSELQNLENLYLEKQRVALAELAEQKDARLKLELHEQKELMLGLVNAANAAREEYLALYTKERSLRKVIHNKLMDIQGNIRVLCRVRPILEVELRNGDGESTTEIPNDEEIVIRRDAATKNKFEFDRIFDMSSSQESVFEAVQPLIVSVLDGYNVCIFAYGQTGSGKTFTMEGYGPNIGVSPRAISELFRIIADVSEEWAYTVTFSTLEIYNETIRDLLDNSNDRDKLDVRQTAEGNVVPGLVEVVVETPEQVLGLMAKAQLNRAVGSHDMNEHSSRSHSIITLTCRGKNSRDNSSTFGKLHLIDLAGSERVGKTDATGDRLKEAQNINRSLSALGDVINALGSKKSTHIPYRNSKLTFLLQDSLGGNSKVIMFVNISPASYNVGESFCSLNFASRCRNVELGQAKKQTGDSGASAVSQLKKASAMEPPASASKAMTSSSSSLRRPAIVSSSGSVSSTGSKK